MILIAVSWSENLNYKILLLVLRPYLIFKLHDVQVAKEF